MGVNPGSTTFWLCGLGQRHREEFSGAIDRAVEWWLMESRGKWQQPGEVRIGRAENRAISSYHPHGSWNIKAISPLSED